MKGPLSHPVFSRRLFPQGKKPDYYSGYFFSAYNLTLNGPFSLQFLQSHNFYNSYLAYEVVFLHNLRNSTGPKGTPFRIFSAL